MFSKLHPVLCEVSIEGEKGKENSMQICAPYLYAISVEGRLCRSKRGI